MGPIALDQQPQHAQRRDIGPVQIVQDQQQRLIIAGLQDGRHNPFPDGELGELIMV